ncbi:MAG: sialidase family protein [Candidatus Methylomirabilales bacterium]
MSRPGRSLPLNLGLSLALAGAGAYLFGTSLSPTAAVGVPVVRSLFRPSIPALLGGNLPINAGARDPSNIDANNSPTLAVNPRDPANLAVSNRIDSQRYSCALHYSVDAGRSWNPTSIPIPEGEEPKCFAPDIVFGGDGNLYVSYVTLKGLGNVPNAVWLVSSADGGRTLSSPNRVRGPLAFQVRLVTDPERELLYLSWLQASEVGLYLFANTGNPIIVSRSDDQGATWTSPAGVSPPGRPRVLAPSPALGGKGELYLLYLDLKEDSLDYHGGHGGQGGEPYPGTWELVLARSSDRGRSWSESVVDDGIVPIERFLVFLPPFPSPAVDPGTGRIYAAFHDARAGDPDVYVWSSADGGRRFGRPTRVNDTPLRDGTSQYLPKLAVAPGGRLDVLYYDRRADPDNLMNEVSFQSSFDEGRTFTRRLGISERAFDSRVGVGGVRGMPDLGSRLSLVSTETSARAVWTDTRAGTPSNLKQDLSFAVVGFSRSARPGAFLRMGGLVLLSAGLLVTVASLVRRSPRARAGNQTS